MMSGPPNLNGCERHAGVVLPNWIGDVVMATPALRALRNHFAPPIRLVGVMRPYVAQVLEGTPWLDEVIFFDRRKQGRIRSLLSVAGQLRARQLGLLVLFPNSFSSGLLARLSGTPRRIGYAGHWRRRLLTDVVVPPGVRSPDVPESAVDLYLGLSYATGCPQEPRRVELATTSRDEAEADQVWATFAWDDKTPVLAINPGSLNGTARNWPPEHIAELARRMLITTDANVLLLCGPAEHHIVAGIERTANSPRIRSLGAQTRLGALKACLRRSRLLVTGDHGPRHLAAGFSVPTLVLCGPFDPRQNDSFNPHESHLGESLDCVPCGRLVCPLGHGRCMTELSVDRVLSAVLDLWRGCRDGHDSMGLARPPLQSR